MADEVDDTTGPSEPKKRLLVNWHLCILCQVNKDERLQCPGNTKRSDGGAGYRTLSDNLHSIIKLDKQSIPLHLANLYKEDQDDCFEEPFTKYYAKWHNTCRANYSKSKVGRIERRLSDRNFATLGGGDIQNSRNTYTRSNENTASVSGECFFCGEPSNNESLHDVTTLEVDARVRTCAYALSDSRILAKLSEGDLIALEAKYHARCLVSFYNRAQRHPEDEQSDANSDDFAMGDAMVFAELISHIEELRYENAIQPLRLADLAKMYQNRLTQQGVTSDYRVNSTRLKERLLNHFPDLTAHSRGRDIYLAFDEGMSTVLKELSNRGATEDAIHLMRAAQIIRRDMFKDEYRFSGSFPDDCETQAVPSSLLSLVRMILEGPSIKDQARTDKIPGSLTISQLLVFNAVKYSRDDTKTQSFRHNTDRETPLPVYIGMMLHSHTRKRELVDKLYDLGLCISYDRVLRLSSGLANEACQQFHKDNAVCPLNLRHGLFTTAAADNLDHNPSSTTSKESFHGTGISLTQHPTHQSKGTSRDTVTLTESHRMSSKTIDPLPLAYSVVKPVATTAIKPAIPKVEGSIIPNSHSEPEAIHEENIWLEHARQATEGDIEVDNISWAAYHSNMQRQLPLPRAIDVLLPMFPDNAHSVSMVRHTMEVVEKSISFLNPGQVPVITFDQPLYALAKEIQWRWPKLFGEDNFVIFLGGLHIEMAMLKVIGDLLKGSGWVELLTQADIASPGQAESYIQASHVTRTRRAHQISAVAIYTLQKRAYEKYCQGLTQDEDAPQFEEWCNERSRESPQFRYWSLVLELQLSMLVFVRSIRESNFILYREALNSFCKWFFAFDHVHYARWVPVHVRDLMQLEQQHPVVAENFHAGMFTVTKTERQFSAISMDQAHEQDNKCVKGDGGAVGLTQDPAALLRWMIAGPEVARVIREFEAQHTDEGVKETESKHHEQQPSMQAKFKTDVESFVEVTERMGNPFEDRGSELYNIDSKVIADQSVVTTIDKLKNLGEAQHSAFVKDRLQESTVSFNDAVKRNKLPLFTSAQKKSASAGKKKLESVKSDCALFSRLYIGCQLRDGDLDDFFEHENQSYPLSLSDVGTLRQGSKSDLLPCLEKMTSHTVEDPNVSAKMIDSAAVVQMLQPGNAKTFGQYAQHVFIPYVLAQFAHTSRIDLVWDTYTSDSLKSAARQKRGTGTRRRVVSSAAIPRNWKDFLRVDENKAELFSYLANEIINHGIIPDGKQLVSTDGQSVLSSPLLDDVSSIHPCTHEEADTRLLLHTRHAASNGCSKILIRTVDTDVVVLAVYAMHTLEVDELWVAIGTGKNLRYLAIHGLYSQFGSNMSVALPFFHSFTGCDTVSSFAYHGKKSAFDVWMSFPGITDTFKELSTTVAAISEASLCELERFVTLMYDHACNTSSVNEARKHLFTKKGRPMDRIPPTKAALVQHIKRAAYQAGWVWSQLMIKSLEIPSPSDWGWVKQDDGWHPLWTTIPDAAQSCRELVRCGCKTRCGARCKCLKAKLPCTNMCHCDGLCNKI